MDIIIKLLESPIFMILLAFFLIVIVVLVITGKIISIGKDGIKFNTQAFKKDKDKSEDTASIDTEKAKSLIITLQTIIDKSVLIGFNKYEQRMLLLREQMERSHGNIDSVIQSILSEYMDNCDNNGDISIVKITLNECFKRPLDLLEKVFIADKLSSKSLDEIMDENKVVYCNITKHIKIKINEIINLKNKDMLIKIISSKKDEIEKAIKDSLIQAQVSDKKYQKTLKGLEIEFNKDIDSRIVALYGDFIKTHIPENWNDKQALAIGEGL